MANTLRAIEEGAVLVDSSLQGMGRSAGNTVTEVLVAILQRRGSMPHIDLKAAMDVGQGLIQPLLGKRGVDPMAVTGGLAKFHSSFTGKVQSYAKKHDIDVRDLIVRLCQEDQVSAPDELLERLSHELATFKMPRVLSIPAFRVETGKDKTAAEALDMLAEGTSGPRCEGRKVFCAERGHGRTATRRFRGFRQHSFHAIARCRIGDSIER